MEKSILWSSTSKSLLTVKSSSLNEDNTFCLTSLTNDQIEAETLWIISSDCRSWPPLYSDSDCGARDCNGEEIDTVLAIESSELRSWCETRVWSLGLWRCRCCCCCRFCSVALLNISGFFPSSLFYFWRVHILKRCSLASAHNDNNSLLKVSLYCFLQKRLATSKHEFPNK